MRRGESVLVVGVLLGLTPASVGARTWRILADGTGAAATIQAGIDSSAGGDTVFVMPGTYLENIDFLGKAIVVQGSGPEVTTIDGSGQETSVVMFVNGEPQDAVLEGFRITGGAGYSPTVTPGGGGVVILEAEPTIRRNWIHRNKAVVRLSGGSTNGHGGGIYCGSQHGIYRPVIEDNLIEDNEAGLLGGGIRVHEESGPIIRRNVIRNNRAVQGDGGGICVAFGRVSVLITGNEVTENQAGDHGGGITVATTAAEVSWNLITENVSKARDGGGSSGGGLDVVTTGYVSVHHNTIVLNLDNSTAYPREGGGISIEQGNVLVEANIIAMTVNGGGIHCKDASGLQARNNLFWSNVPEHDIACGIEFGETSGNVVADPQFCNPDIGDFSLAKNSPALTHPAGPLGAFLTPGCEDVVVEPMTWSRLKATYGRP